MFASAAVLKQAAFEGTLDGGFTGDGGTPKRYETGVDEQTESEAYPFDSFGDYYCAIDADSDSPLTNSVSGTVFDMFVQFKAVEGAEVPSDAKIAIYLNSETNLVVVGDQAYDCGSPVAADSWARLTIAQVSGGYKVYVGGIPLAATGITDNTFPAKYSGSATTVAFTGSGKLDNFVARTTNPFEQPSTYVASVGGEDGERYATFADALADAAADSVIELNGNVDGTFALPAAGAKIKLNGYTFSGFASVTGDPLLVVVASTADGVTTYSSAYFPRTATAGQDGSAEHPYEIADVDDLKALQAAVAAGKGADKCYVQTADIALTEAWPGIGLQNGKDVVSDATKFDVAAFCGTFDGQNHTISGFQMVGVAGNPKNNGEGLDYCGFFNSTYGATIKNLKIQYAGALFAADTTASTKESGATFVGVAKNSTLQNLTSLQKDEDTAVSCSKGFGGIVGYTTSGTTVDSCTNNVNMTSLAKNKCGGIAMITQNGAAVTISNCQNNGTQTTGSANSEYGAIVGYVGLDTTIANCETTVGRFLKHQGNTVTLQGVNKGDARVASYHGAATPGLNFATVNGNVATFVADDALALYGSYKVMATNAVATFEFDAAGTIEFDTTLYTPTYAVTSDESKIASLDSTTVDNVTTYTAVAGVASVGGQAYATMQDAFDAVTAQNDTVTLLSDLTETVTLNPNETVAITLVPNNHNITTATPFAAANGIVLGGLSDNGDGTWSMNVTNNKASTWTGTAGDELWATASNWSTGVVPSEYTTVTFNDAGRVRIASNNDVVSVAGMVVNAAVTFSETNIDYSKYPAVKICGGNVTGTGTLTLERCGLSGNGSQVEVGCDLVFKGDSATTHDCFLQNGPFVLNGGVSSTLGRLHLITPVTFNGEVSLENATMTSTVSGGAAPTFNGAVTLGEGATISTYAVTYNNALTIGEGAVVSVGSSTQTYGENFTMTGSGRFIGDTQLPGVKVRESLTQSTWTGICELKGMTIKSVWWITDYGNENSKVCFNNVTTYLYNSSYSGSHMVAGIEIGAGGLKVNGNYSGGSWTLPALSGSGTFTVGTAGNNNKNFYFPADCSEFSGSIAFASDTENTRVVFGTTDREFKAKSIVVGSGAEVGAGAWTAENGIFVDGTVSLASASSALTVPEGGVVGSGKIVASAVPATAPALDADNWTGTFVADWEGEVLSANKGKRIDFNSYGTANSIVEVTKLARGYDGTGNDYTVVPTVKVSGTMTLDNGYSGKITTLTKLTGSGAVTFKNYTVNITTLDNFSGTLTPTDATGTTIGTINLESTPAAGTKIVSLGENAKVNIDSTKVSVSGVVDDTIKLELKSDGIYVAEPPAAKVAEIVGGEQYETLAEALAAATDGATVKLLADITLDARVEPNLGAGTALTIDLGGYTITREGTGGNGSAFDVKSGTVVITNGVIDCTQDDAAIVADGVYAITARSGANVTLGGLTVTVNSECGACVYPFSGATVTILSGTYANTTSTPYRYKQAWTGMAVNQVNPDKDGGVRTQRITIYGGSFKQVNPALGDDSWADGEGTFLASGYAATWNPSTGYWDVAESAGGFPGGADGKTFTIDGEVTLPAGKALTDTASAATGLTYAQAAVLGLLDKEGALKEDVTPTIEVKNGKVVVSLDGTAVDATRYTVMLNVYEKSSLTAQWPAEPTTSYELGSETEAAGFTPSAAGAGFYKVGVTIEDAE